jgi:hypothetical protein
MDATENPFSKIQGKYLVAIWILPIIWLPGAESILYALTADPQWYWWNIVFYYYSSLLFAVAILITGAYGRVNWYALFGDRASRETLIPGLKLTLLIFLFSMSAVYATFIPFSYLSPEFVQWWYIDTLSVIYTDGSTYPFLPNLLGFVSLVIIAPVVEEVAFRGILLHRWSYKWGMKKAIIISSFIFAVLHIDPIGAFVFGVGMCILYLRFQSLWVPIFCHAANNLVVWILEAYYRASAGPDAVYTLDDFRSEWFLGIIYAAIIVLWVYFYLQNPKGLRQWRLPALQ